MPGVSDPGRARHRGDAPGGAQRVEVLPGASAALTALVGSGLPTDRFLFVGFLPRQEGERHAQLGALRTERATLIFYEAPSRVGTTLADLAAAFGGTRRAEVARELSKMFEERIPGSLAMLAERYAETPPRGECVLVVAGASPSDILHDVAVARPRVRHQGAACAGRASQGDRGGARTPHGEKASRAVPARRRAGRIRDIVR